MDTLRVRMGSWVARTDPNTGYILARHAEIGSKCPAQCPFGRYSAHMDFKTATQRRAASIREAIDLAGHTPFSIAEATGIPRTTLNRRLLGASPFNTEELDAIALALGTNVTDLLMEEAA